MEPILSLSYGKDSLACLGAIERLGWPLDRIVHAEVWATDTIPADLPPMVEFKARADEIIKARWGITVEHVCGPYTFEQGFYLTRGRTGQKTKFAGCFYGWPMVRGPWCLQQLKLPALAKCTRRDDVQYIGIAADEPERIARHEDKANIKMPLVALGWTEADCRQWCEGNGLLSPIYTTAARGGCWFCHNQSVDQLRLLRRNYPEYWELMLKWDADSPVTFKPDGHTVHDYERRFAAEDASLIMPDEHFTWAQLDDPLLNYRLF